MRAAAAAGVGVESVVTPGAAADPTGGPRNPAARQQARSLGSRRREPGPVLELRRAGAATVLRPRQRTAAAAAAGAPPLCAVSDGVRLRGHGEARADPGPRPTLRPQIQRPLHRCSHYKS